MRMKPALVFALASASIVLGSTAAHAAPPSDTWPGKAPESAAATKQVSGSATAYDTVVRGERYKASVSQSFRVKFNGINAPRYVDGSYDFSKGGSFGSDIASANINADGPSVSSGSCSMLPGKACLVVKASVHGTVTTKWGNKWSQDGTLTTEVSETGDSVTTLDMGTASKR